jgi:DnaK suppressor protein
MTQEI